MVSDILVAETSSANNEENDRVRANEICFGEFVLFPQQHLLLRNGEPVPLGSRAILLLIALVSRPGELLAKTELLAHVWPRLVVEECNLRAQVLALRRALGEGRDWIVTVAGRGYRFVAPISRRSISTERTSREMDEVYEPSIARSFGREELLGILEVKLASHRFVTITGHAGVGKTTVALALANRMQRQYPEGNVFIDLATSDRNLPVSTLIAQVLGLDCLTEDPLRVVTRHLESHKMLLVFDSCEAVLEDTAQVIEAILRSARQCLVLVTSREPLGANGEFVHELAPLQFPTTSDQLDSVKALSYPAITLLVNCMVAHNMGYIFTNQHVRAAVAICQKLDGNPLGIEIAAARVRSFGLEHLAEMVDGDWRLQMIGRRTAPHRHRSLAAALDFTYTLLSRQEQAMLGQLSVFSGSFTLRAVTAVIHADGQDLAQTLERLVSKSLVVSRGQSPVKRYRLLETTRLYAAQKVGTQAEKDLLARRHARWVLDEQKRSVEDLDSMTPQAWLEHYGAEIDSVRTALAWAYSTHGDAKLAVELTLVSVPLWSRLSLTDECQGWIKRGLNSDSESCPVQQHQRMLLVTAATSAS
ncbi:ATP-binding protein [Pseudomonas sp. X10]